MIKYFEELWIAIRITHENTIKYIRQKKRPFFFLIDFSVKDYYIAPLETIQEAVLFSIDGFCNTTASPKVTAIPKLNIEKPIDFIHYQKAFNTVQQEMRWGNTYLLNLTFPTTITINTSLKNIFLLSKAKFKLYFQDKFVVFSPERFIKIENDTIHTFPMKGTIDATVPNAVHRILTDEKEKAEHVMVVDLLRNDLAMVAKQVRLQKFRYIDKVKAGSQALLQVSSHISGVLDKHWPQRIGDILIDLLPAGSISGAPKRKTVEIIKSVENYDRGFFTGVFGYFDGKNLDSAVAIRFIEQEADHAFYKSGGGITLDSEPMAEYQELLRKVYIPV